MTIRVRSAVLRVPLLVLATLFLAGVGATVAALYHVRAASADPITCGGGATNPATPFTINLTGGTVTLTSNGSTLTVNSSVAGTCSVSLTGTSEIDFAVASAISQATTVVIDQSGTNSLLPCMQLNGNIGTTGNNDGIIKVLTNNVATGTPNVLTGEPITIGSSDINLRGCSSFTTGNAGGSTFSAGSLTGINSYQIVESPTITAGSPVTQTITGTSISANGDFTTGGTAASVPVTVTAGTAGANHTDAVVISNSFFTGGAGTSTFTISGAGTNTYSAEAGAANFYDSGSGNTIDFSNAPAAAGSALTVNVSGSNQLSGTEKNGQAALGTNVAYTFAKAANSFDPSGFSTIKGALSGDTQFFAGDATGFNFVTNGTGNSADFSAADQPINADLSQYPASVSVRFFGSDTLTPEFVDFSNPLTEITGSSVGGDVFTGGPTNPPDSRCLGCFLPSSTYSFTSSSAGTAASSRFIAGTGPATFKGGSKNIVDLSQLIGTATVNDSGVPGGSPATGSACSPCTGTVVTYDFSGLSSPTTFLGSQGGTSFLGGITADNFVGFASAANELSFASAPSGSLLVCAAIPSAGSCSTGKPNPPTVPAGTTAIGAFSGQSIVGGAIHEGISGITTFDGLGTQSSASPTTVFADGNGTSSTPGGNTFTPTAGTNKADFSQVGTGITADLSSGTGLVNGRTAGTGLVLADNIGAITSVINSSTGNNLDIAGSASDTFADLGSNKTDTIDFSHVLSSGNSPLTINVSGVLNGIAPNTALAGSTSYFFDQAHAGSNDDFRTFIGSTVGGEKTVFLASGTSGYSFSGLSSDVVDFSAASSVNVDLSTFSAGNVTVGGGSDSVIATAPATTGPTSITGGSSGKNVFQWGNNGPFLFNGKGGGNRFIAGATSSSASSGNATLQGGTDNIVDLSLLSGAATVNDSGVAGGSPATGKASAGSALYDFNGLSSPTTFLGSGGGTKFFGGLTGDNFVGTGGSNELTYASAPSGSLLVCAAIPTAGACAGTPPTIAVPTGTGSIPSLTGQAVVGGAIHQWISGITTFDGLGTQSSSSPSTTFADGNSTATTPGGNTFVPTAGTTKADFSRVGTGITANLVTGQVTGRTPGSGLVATDVISGITSVVDSSQGNNLDIAGTSSDTFADLGSNATDTLDFSNVPSSGNNPLTINVSGVLNGIAPNTALVGSTSYFFDQAHAGSNDTFRTLIGSTGNGEKTVFLASGTSGYTFSGLTNDAVDFSAATSVSVNLTTFSAGNVSVGGGTDSVLATSPSTQGPTSITGGSSGSNIFQWGSNGPFTFNGKGNANRFEPAAISAFSAGGDATLLGGSNNILDLSGISQSATVNDSGVAGGSPPTGKASAGSAAFDFSGLTSPTTFLGSGGGTKFFGGITADNFVGTSATGNELTYASAPSSSLLICAAIPTTGSCSSGVPTVPTVGTPSGQVVIGGAIHQGIQGISIFDGLTGGSTTFADGKSTAVVAGGHTFNATSGTNSADFSQVNAGVSINLATTPGTVSSSGLTANDLLSGVTTVTGSTFGTNSFTAGPSTSETFQDFGSGHQDVVDFSNVSASGTTPLLVNLSNHPVSGVDTGHASVVASGVTYTFNNTASNFTNFIGSSSGFTRFAASEATGGLTFTAKHGTSGNTADFGLSTTGITADVTPVGNGSITFTGGTPSADALRGSFIDKSGSNTIIGSSSSANTFFGEVTGTTFTANSPSNTLSYLNYDGLTGITFDLKNNKVASTSGTSDDLFSFPNSTSIPQQQPILQGSPLTDVFKTGGTAATVQGGGTAPETLDLSQSTSGDTVDMQSGSVAGSSIGALSFAFGCSGPTQFCIGTITGSTSGDNYIPNAAALSGSLPLLHVAGNGGPDIFNLQNVTDTAKVCMPIIGTSPLTNPPCTTQGFITGQVGSLAGNTGTPALGITSLSVSPLTTPVATNDLIRVATASDANPLNSQVFTAAAPAVAGATSIPVVGAVPVIDFQVGSSVIDLTSPAVSGISFNGVSNLVGTSPGADYLFAGSGNEQFQDVAPATLDFSNLHGIALNQTGMNVTAGTSQSGTANAPLAAGSAGYTWSGFQTIVGTAGSDAFTQTAPGSYNFIGLGGTNTLDLSGVSGGATMTFDPADSSCTGANNSDGTAISTQLADAWTCMSNVVAPGNTAFNMHPGETAGINGGGSGTVNLVGDTTGLGAVVDLTTSPALVTGDGYNFTFSGMSTINGTPFDDTFIPGSNNVKVNGGGGQDGITYTCPPSAEAPGCVNAPNPVDINLSTANYLIPSGYSGAGNSVNGCTAIGGFGGVMNFLNGAGTACTISNGVGSVGNTDILIAGAGVSNLTGGSGNDRFVLTNNGVDQIVAGTGSATLDLSLLSGFTSVDLGSSGVQSLPSGSVKLASGDIKTVLASPGGSYLRAGTGTGVILQGGTGNDILAGGDATGGSQTLIGGGGSDIILGGIGNDTMIGGSTPSTFLPGEGNDTIQSSTTGNALYYLGAFQGITANLSAADFKVPSGKPFGGQTFPALTVNGGFPGSSVDISQAGITRMYGSPFSDAFVSGGNDTLNGFGGDDLFAVEPGSSTLIAGNGSSSDFLFEGSGSNIIHGGGNSTLDFSQAPNGVTVDLQKDSATGGFGGTQNVSGIQNIIGTQHNDVLVGDGQNQTIIGLNGNDLLQAGPGGNDTLISDGGGNDTFCSISCVGGTTSSGGSTAATENVMIGGSGDDTFFTRNGGFDGMNGEGGINNAQIDSNDSAANIQTFLP